MTYYITKSGSGVVLKTTDTLEQAIEWCNENGETTPYNIAMTSDEQDIINESMGGSERG